VLDNPIVGNGSILYSGDAFHTRLNIGLTFRTYFCLLFYIILKKIVSLKLIANCKFERKALINR